MVEAKSSRSGLSMGVAGVGMSDDRSTRIGISCGLIRISDKDSLHSIDEDYGIGSESQISVEIMIFDVLRKARYPSYYLYIE